MLCRRVIFDAPVLPAIPFSPTISKAHDFSRQWSNQVENDQKKTNRENDPTHSQTQTALDVSSRRRFLENAGGLLTASLLAGPALSEQQALAQEPENLPAGSNRERAETAYQLRLKAAQTYRELPLTEHPTNGDETLYPNKTGNFSKTLPHNQLGEVDLIAYQELTKAATSGRADDFDRIPLGGSVPLTNPQAGMAFDLLGFDSRQLAMPAAPALASREIAAEIAENYWMALTRDVHFQDYGNHPMTVLAAQDLSRFTDFRGPKSGRPAFRRAPLGRTVSIQTLFRGNTPGELTGPYVSQFMLKEIPYGSQTNSQKMRTPLAGDDYMTTYEEWLDVQRGAPRGLNRYDQVERYIRNGRDLGEWVHRDVLFQAYFNGLLLLLGMNAPFDAQNPYNNVRNQAGFGTFGPPHIQSLVCGVASSALRAVWYQKWFVHRRLRPEAFAGRVHNHIT
ncbi:MAG: hypothetical protein ACKV2V_24350, partial [Blastocatellia bacterium]